MKRTNGKDGIALIIVLGFLSLMVVMAVMFVGRARVERLVGDSTLAAMSARSVLRSGIAQGMNAYSRMLWDDKVIMPAGKGDYEIYLSGDTKDSGDYEYGEAIGDDTDLLGEYGDTDRELAKYWVPERYWDVDVADAKWIYQKAYDHVAKKDRIVGRYAYAIFDVSGGVDVNLIARVAHGGGEGGSTNRTNVRYFTEEAANCLKDVKGAMGVCDLVEDYGGFDSFFEMRRSLGQYIDVENLNNVVPYSMSAFRGTSYRVGSGDWTQPVNAEDLSENDWLKLLAGTADETVNRSLHQMQDSLAGLSDSDRKAIAQALMDFTSEDIVPQGLDYPSVKDVPMLNETRLKLDLVEEPHSGSDDKPDYSIYTLKVELDLETWFPFPVSDRDKEKFKIPAPVFKLVSGAGGGGDNSIAFRYGFQGATGYTIQRPNLEKETDAYEFTPDWNEGKPQHMEEPFKYEIPITATCGGNGWNDSEEGHLPQGLTLVLQPQGTTKLSVEHDAARVDEIELALVNAKFLQLKKESGEVVYDMEVADPRMNHLPELWVAGEEDGTMGDYNEAAKQAVKQNLGVASPVAGDYAMFCRNGPLETPGDLGYIPVIGAKKSLSSAWKTLDLFSLDAAWLMRQLVSRKEAEYARTDPISGNKLTFPKTLPVYTNGTINPNTPLTNVLQAAFRDLTAEGIAGWDNTSQNKKELGESDAATIASRIIGYRTKGGYDTEESLGKGYDFASGSDWVTAFADTTWHKQLENLFANRPKNVREGLIRQTWGLFRPEDNLFVMIVVGQAIKEGPTGTLGRFDADDDTVVGEKRAALLVWRDPFPVGDNPHMEMSTILYKALID
ncbi:MAG: hypothetical protein IJS32_00175 [Kiritimatiellae bacterium]|nr:hypothetical protein [Kiritimatiellia bacterium]